nr:asparagine synthase (glutamine-hydrolyzing) [uncultured Carboxylicivirga sp.]
MCGIGGVLFSNKSQKHIRQILLNMEQLQLHRGPDEQNIWTGENHGLCHQRLSIIDIKNGQQPFKSNNGRYILTYNGELYNHQQLKDELHTSYSFKTNSDTEIVLAAYINWGTQCVHRFIGMFSFLIWDTETQTAFAARDLLGVKPFVYSYINGEFTFASEVKTLASVLSNSLDINPYSLAETIISPSLSGVTDSLFNQIAILQAGTYLQVNQDGIVETNYALTHINPALGDEKHIITTFRNEFERSISYSLHSDVEIGCFLSGGLDSSYIAAQAQRQNSTLKTYGIVFDNHDKIEFSPDTIVCSNDKPFTDLMIKKYRLNHKEVNISQDMILNEIEQIVTNNDRISVWEQEISQHFLAQKASKDVKAVMVGDAADEMNYGYFFLLNKQYNTSPLAISNLFGGNERLNILNPAFVKQTGIKDYLYHKYENIAQTAGYHFDKGKEERILATTTLITKLWLGRLLHNGDIHTMNSSLEGRVPFANQNLYQISKTIHPSLGFKNNIEKYVVREAAKGTLIDEIRLRKKSALPRDPRLARAYQQILVNLLQEKNPFCEQYFNTQYLNKLAHDKHMTEQKRMMIFSCIAAIYWGKKYHLN